jgi:hypothetical protein
MASNLPEFASTTISTDSALAAATVGLVSKVTWLYLHADTAGRNDATQRSQEEFTRRREAIEKTELERQVHCPPKHAHCECSMRITCSF